jgi:hypothetical protein
MIPSPESLRSDDLPKPAERERVELCFPARVELVILARFTAATIGARAGFGVDDIEDLRLAVDELCVSLGPLTEDRSIRVMFERCQDVVDVSATFARSDEAADADEASSDALWSQSRELSERLLDSLVDEYRSELRHSHRVSWLKKHRTNPDR